MLFPADGHVHSEWSWDAFAGSMTATCERAVALGLPAIAFTEHVDHTVWRVVTDDPARDHHLVRMTGDDGLLHPPAFDVAGYLAQIEECRLRFPSLRILTGVELGEPHRHRSAVEATLAAGSFERVLGSLHTLADGSDHLEPAGLFPTRRHDQVMRDYLAELAVLAASPAPFDILAHIDYPVRSWPAQAGPFRPGDFEDEFREVLALTAAAGRALEVNTKVPLHGVILRWWREANGRAITFGSDAHEAEALARGLADAAAMAEAYGYGPGASPLGFWERKG